MPTYVIRTGALHCAIETPFDADGVALALLVVQQNLRSEHFGAVLSVTGGQYVRGNELWCYTKNLLAKLGHAAA
jgi:hypothetical protein